MGGLLLLLFLLLVSPLSAVDGAQTLFLFFFFFLFVVVVVIQTGGQGAREPAEGERNVFLCCSQVWLVCVCVSLRRNVLHAEARRTLAEIPCVKVELFKSPRVLDTSLSCDESVGTQLLSLQHMGGGVCGGGRNRRDLNKLGSHGRYSSDFEFIRRSRNQVSWKAALFLRPRQLQPFLLGVEYQAVSVLSFYERRRMSEMDTTQDTLCFPPVSLCLYMSFLLRRLNSCLYQRM